MSRARHIRFDDVDTPNRVHERLGPLTMDIDTEQSMRDRSYARQSVGQDLL